MIKKFTYEVDWRTYRLTDTNPLYTAARKKSARRQHKDMKGLIKSKFSGKDAVSVIYFLRQYRNECNDMV